MVHLGSFLLAIVSKNVHFSHYCVSRVSWAPVESAHTGTWEWWGACCLSFWSLSKSACFQGGVFPKGKVIECVLSLVLRVTGFDERKMHALLPHALWGSTRLDIEFILFPGGCIPECCDKWKAIECVLSRVLQFNVHGYMKITLLPNKTGGAYSRKKRQMESN